LLFREFYDSTRLKGGGFFGLKPSEWRRSVCAFFDVWRIYPSPGRGDSSVSTTSIRM